MNGRREVARLGKLVRLTRRAALQFGPVAPKFVGHTPNRITRRPITPVALTYTPDESGRYVGLVALAPAAYYDATLSKHVERTGGVALV